METLIKLPGPESTYAGTTVTEAVKRAEDKAHEKILNLIVHQDDVGWKAIIFELIESEQMDPWDIDISRLSQRFLRELKKLKEHDFRISGKVVLASAVLLKMKADRLKSEELAALDNLIQSVEEPMELDLDELEIGEERPELPKLIPRTPQPRRRKVSVYDLVEALEEALELEARRPPQVEARILDKIDPPSHHVDISVIIKEVYDRIFDHYETKKNSEILQFEHLARSQDPRDLVMAFIPLLHLENARKVEMQQDEHFGPISVHLLDTTPPDAKAMAKEITGE